MQKIDDEDKELKNFPLEMGQADDDQWEDYSHVRRGDKDSRAVKLTWRLFKSRLFPVLAFLDILSVFGVSLAQGTHFLFDKSAHMISLMIILWISLAPFSWIFAAVTSQSPKTRTIWYYCVAGLQAGCGVIFYLLFPFREYPWLDSLQFIFVSSLPMQGVIYYFFIYGGLPQKLAHGISLCGGLFMLYGIIFA